ncbi:hypothetical protein P7H75_04850, partial [Vagococcus carniphilus]|nr:hypothetical protein [Vagococcus carniphilus]
MVNFFALIIVIGITGIWFFTKKKPDKQKRLISIIVSILAFLGFGLFTELDKKDNDSKNKVTDSTIKETTSSSVVETIETSESKSDKKGCTLNRVDRLNSINAIFLFWDRKRG